MGEKLKEGDYGEISFILKKKRKEIIPGVEPYIITGFVLERARIVETDKKTVLIVDNDGEVYIPQRSWIRYFTPKPEPKSIQQ